MHHSQGEALSSTQHLVFELEAANERHRATEEASSGLKMQVETLRQQLEAQSLQTTEVQAMHGILGETRPKGDFEFLANSLGGPPALRRMLQEAEEAPPPDTKKAQQEIADEGDDIGDWSLSQLQ